MILSIQDVSPNLLFENFLTQFMDCQSPPPFLGTKYSDFLHFHRQCGCSFLYDKYSIYSIYYYLETSMAPTTLLSKTPPTNTI